MVRKIRDALKSSQGKAVLDVLLQLNASPQTKVNSCSTSWEWADRINHGGLISVTDEVFQLFYSTEYCIR